MDKPPGLHFLPDGYDPSLPHLKSLLEPLYGPLWIVHRLDKDTSGVVLLARSAQVHRLLNTQFETRQVAKTYHALVAGIPPWGETTLDLPLRPNADRRHRTLPDQLNGQPALTAFRLLERFTGYALLKAQPFTGRTHQVRAHLSALGLPLLGDPLYGGPPGLFLSQLKPGLAPRDNECPILARPALHARSLSLAHPLDEAPLLFEAPYPKDFSAALRQLRKYGAMGGTTVQN